LNIRSFYERFESWFLQYAWPTEVLNLQCNDFKSMIERLSVVMDDDRRVKAEKFKDVHSFLLWTGHGGKQFRGLTELDKFSVYEKRRLLVSNCEMYSAAYAQLQHNGNVNIRFGFNQGTITGLRILISLDSLLIALPLFLGVVCHDWVVCIFWAGLWLSILLTWCLLLRCIHWTERWHRQRLCLLIKTLDQGHSYTYAVPRMGLFFHTCLSLVLLLSMPLWWASGCALNSQVPIQMSEMVLSMNDIS
jgi:hypothetical protein